MPNDTLSSDTLFSGTSGEKTRVNELRGELNADGVRFGIVVSRFNSFITERLLAGALDALQQGGADAAQTDVARVPGAFEIPLAAKQMAAGGRYGAVIAIGCILRGETSHFDYIASEVSRGVMLAQMDTGVPIIFCVLTCDTLEQAIDRAGLKSGNKGYEAGLAALEMARLSRRLRGGAGVGVGAPAITPAATAPATNAMPAKRSRKSR